MKYFVSILALTFMYVLYAVAEIGRDETGNNWWFVLSVAAWISAVQIVAYMQYERSR